MASAIPTRAWFERFASPLLDLEVWRFSDAQALGLLTDAEYRFCRAINAHSDIVPAWNGVLRLWENFEAQHRF